MVKYLCKEFSIDEIIKCSFNLSDSELKVFLELMKCKTSVCVNVVAKKLNKDRSTIQKLIAKLIDKKIIKKTRKTLDDGGHIFYYSIIDKSELKKTICKTLDCWYCNVKKEVFRW
jgi:predicted transcriptional regulator